MRGHMGPGVQQVTKVPKTAGLRNPLGLKRGPCEASGLREDRVDRVSAGEESLPGPEREQAGALVKIHALAVLRFALSLFHFFKGCSFSLPGPPF